MPRIAHVISTPAGFGGAERVLASLVEDGAQRGWAQLVLNPFAESLHGDLNRALGDAPYEASLGSSFGDLPRLRRWVTDSLADFRPDVVHTHLFHAEMLVATTSRTRPRPRHILTHHHGAGLLRQRRFAAGLADLAMLRRFDRVVAVSHEVERFLTRTGRLPASRIDVITNGWAGEPLEHRGGGGRTVVCVGRLRREKGQAVLLDAFQRVRDEIDAHLILVGDGPLLGELQTQAHALGIGSSVTFVGTAEDVWPHLAAADLAVVPSHFETLGLAALEAMAAGIPIVASRVGGLPEVVTHESDGLLVPPGDPVALAHAIRGLLTDPARREAMGLAARKSATTHTMARTVAHYAELYESW
jgi:glycosyltransferase involved in cell wall biosynthesis